MQNNDTRKDAYGNWTFTKSEMWDGNNKNEPQGLIWNSTKIARTE